MTKLMSLHDAAALVHDGDMIASGGNLLHRGPYTGTSVLAIPPIRPRWALIHVTAADVEGNARIEGSEFEDVLMSHAAEGVILTTERIVPSEDLTHRPELTKIPGFLVTAVV